MTNAELYKKTFRFTLMRILTRLIGAILIIGLPTAACLIARNQSDEAIVFIGLGTFVLACVVVGLFSHFIGYMYRAGQIAMVAEGIVTGTLPDDPYAEGKTRAKKRFGTVAVFFAIEKVINAIVRQITNAVNRLTDSVSKGAKNSAAGYVGAAVNLFVSAVLSFLCACCMGWVFVHPDENPWRSACDGAIVYFKNWKALLKNAGKVIALGLASLILLGGLLFGLTWLATDSADFLNNFSQTVAEELAEENAEASLTANEVKLILQAVTAFILWIVVHAALVNPYIMISVMNRYLKAGMANPPARSMDEKLTGLSKAYGKALTKAEA